MLAFLLPLPVAAAAGVAAGASPHTTLATTAAAASALVLVLRVEWAALAVIGSAVFADYLALVSSWATEWLAAVLVVAWAIRRAHGPLHQHRLRRAAVPAGLLAVAVVVAYLAHPNGRAGLVDCATYAELVVVMLVLADALCGPLAPRRAARTYMLSCALASCCGIVTAVVDDRHRVVGPVSNPDTLAFFLIAALPLVGTVRTRNSQPVWWVWACLAALMVAGVGTQSRAAFVALLVMIVVAVLSGTLALRYAGALVAVVTSAVAFVIALLPVSLGHTISDPQRYADTNVARRVDLGQAAFQMTLDSPLVGLGPAAYPLLHKDYREVDADPVNRDVDVAYSTVLESSAELGVLGLVALYAVWLAPAAAARRRWLRDRSPLTAALLLAMVGLLTASVLESEQHAFPLWFVAAMTLARGRPRRPRTSVFGGNSSGQVGARE